MIEIDIEKIRSSNASEFNKMYDQYYDKIFKNIYSKIGNRPDTEELVQETFIKVFKNLDYYNSTKGDLYSFILSNCKQVIADYYKVKIPRKDKVEEVELNENIGDELDLDIENEYDLESVINTLPKEQQIAFKLIYIKKLSYKAAGRVMNKSESSIKSLAFRARKTLRQKIVSENPEIGRRYGFREALKLFIISVICAGLIGGLTYAIVRLYVESVKKEKFTLNEVFTDVPDEESEITREEATNKINEYLEIFGIDSFVEEEELHLNNDFFIGLECWNVENEEYLIKINSKDGNLVSLNILNITIVKNNDSIEDIISKLEISDNYELYNIDQNNNYIIYNYVKKYDNIFNKYQKVTIMFKDGKFYTYTKLDYNFEDKEIKISREDAMRIAQENGIEVKNMELVIEKIITDSSDYYDNKYEDINKYEYLMKMEKSIIIKAWKIENNSGILCYVDSFTGKLYTDNLLNERNRSN